MFIVKNNELNITLKGKISNLCDITIVSGKMQKCIVDRGASTGSLLLQMKRNEI